MQTIIGNTYPVKEQIKALGGKWNSAKKGWDVPDSKAEQAWALLGVPSNTPEPVAVALGNFAGVIALFNTAKAHLKYPKIRLACDGHVIVLALAGEKSKEPGTVTVTDGAKWPDNLWYGRVTPTGNWTPGKHLSADMTNSMLTLLTKLAADPARVASKYGKLTGQCCFCGLPLDEKHSVAAGFGPTCAKNYGLHEQWKNAVKKGQADSVVKDLTGKVVEHKTSPTELAFGLPKPKLESGKMGHQAIEKAVAAVESFAQSIADTEAPAVFGTMLFSESHKGPAPEDESVVERTPEGMCALCERVPATVEVEGAQVCASCQKDLLGV